MVNKYNSYFVAKANMQRKLTGHSIFSAGIAKMFPVCSDQLTTKTMLTLTFSTTVANYLLQFI